MVDGDESRAGSLADERLEHGAAGTEQVAAQLLEQFGAPAIAVAARMPLDEPLLGRGEHSLEVDEQAVVDEVGMHVARPPAHELLLEARYGVAHGGLDFAL